MCKPFFPADTDDMAHLIASLFHKKGILRLMKACKNEEEIISYRTNLFIISASLINGPGNNLLEEIYALKQLVKKQAVTVDVQENTSGKQADAITQLESHNCYLIVPPRYECVSIFCSSIIHYLKRLTHFFLIKLDRNLAADLTLDARPHSDA